MLSKARGLPSCIKITPIPCHEASHSTIIFFVKSGVANTGVVHIASLCFSKGLVASSVQENVSLFNNVFRGVYILP
jgi:hypothetical protein